MFAASSRRPNAEQRTRLRADLDVNLALAAEAVHDSNVLVLITGAGFSADSGLAVYADVANVRAYRDRGLEYHDICQTHWIETDPGLFYGFWGQCLNDYRDARPHEGYHIVAKWRNDKNRSNVADEIRARVAAMQEASEEEDEVDDATDEPYNVEGCAGAFFSFTSNVDGHSFDVFDANEIRECHGNVELWQCHRGNCRSKIWRAPLDHRFVVDRETMLAPARADPDELHILTRTVETTNTRNDESETAHVGHTTGSLRTHPLKHMIGSEEGEGWACRDPSSNWPVCGECGGPARPAILMFGDWEWNENGAQDARFSKWETAIYALAEEHKLLGKQRLKVCILEVGCGLNVPTCRYQSENMAEELQKRGGKVKLVRINPDYPFADSSAVSDNVISVMSTGLEALQKMDQIYIDMEDEENG